MILLIDIDVALCLCLFFCFFLSLNRLIAENFPQTNGALTSVIVDAYALPTMCIYEVYCALPPNNICRPCRLFFFYYYYYFCFCTCVPLCVCFILFVNFNKFTQSSKSPIHMYILLPDISLRFVKRVCICLILLQKCLTCLHLVFVCLLLIYRSKLNFFIFQFSILYSY